MPEKRRSGDLELCRNLGIKRLAFVRLEEHNIIHSPVCEETGSGIHAL
jgi:hypothetical protein